MSLLLPVTWLTSLNDDSTEKRSAVEHICQALCGINDNGTGKRHLIVVTFDHPNHGSRLVNKLSNFGWKEGRYENPTHAQDMWSMFYSSSQTVSALIDVLESYLFGPQEHKIVEKWGVLGFSMGGHASFLAAANGRFNDKVVAMQPVLISCQPMMPQILG